MSGELQVVAEDEVGEQGERGAEPFGVGGAELGRHAGGGPRRGRHEEPGDGQLEGAGEGDDLVGVEVADAVAVDGALGGGVVGLRPADAEVGLEGLAGLVLGPALQEPGLGEVVGDDLVRGEPEVERDLVVAACVVPSINSSTRVNVSLTTDIGHRCNLQIPDGLSSDGPVRSGGAGGTSRTSSPSRKRPDRCGSAAPPRTSAAKQYRATGGAEGLPVVAIRGSLRVPGGWLEEMAGGPIDLDELGDAGRVACRPATRHARDTVVGP